MPALGFKDDPEILDGDVLFRVVPPKDLNWDDHDDEGNLIVPSQSWQDHRAGVAAWYDLPGVCASSAVERLLTAEGHAPDKLLDRFSPKHGVISIPVSRVRGLTNSVGDPCPQGVMMWPMDGQPWHAVVWTMRENGQRSKGEKRALARCSSWVIPPTPD